MEINEMKNEMKINETARPLYRMRVHSSHVVTNHVIRNLKEMSIQPIKKWVRVDCNTFIQ